MSLLLIRHATAGDRQAWEADDRVRPVDERGRRQSDALVDTLAGYTIDRIVSSPYLRCVQSVQPLAEARGLEIELDEQLGATRLEEVGEVLERLRGENVGRLHTRRPSVARRPEVQEGRDLDPRRRARAEPLHQAARLVSSRRRAFRPVTRGRRPRGGPRERRREARPGAAVPRRGRGLPPAGSGPARSGSRTSLPVRPPARS